MASAPESSALEVLRTMFPHAAEESLTAVLEMNGSDLNAATNFLLNNDLEEIEAEIEASLGTQSSTQPASELPQIQTGTTEDEDEGDEEDDAEPSNGDDEGEGEDVEETGDQEEEPPPKRLRVVKPTPPEQLRERKSHFVRFDNTLLRKTDLELLNMTLSCYAHTAITLWADEVPEQKWALSMLEGATVGWWVQHFAVAEVDHVWRLICNAHICSKSLGAVVHVCGHSFDVKGPAGAEVEVRVLVRDCDDLAEVKRIGSGLLALAPASQNQDYILFQRGPLKAGHARDSKTRLEEKSVFKLTRGRVKASEGGPKQPFACIDRERIVYQLFKVEKLNPTQWVEVDV